MKHLTYLLLIAISFSNCTNTSTEKYQKNRDNVINIKDKIKEIEIPDSILIGSVARAYVFGDYLLIMDATAYEKQLKIFDKNNYSYISGAIQRGRGPGEIVRIGHIAFDEPNRAFFITDAGKLTIFSYHLDSIVKNPLYMPQVKMDMDKGEFPSTYVYINDTLSIGRIIEPVGNADFKESVGRWNMNIGTIEKMKYEHPDIKKKRIRFDAAPQYGVYVEAYAHHDLITICDFDGNLIYNIYGKNYNTRVSNEYTYFDGVAICGDKIVASYSGKTTYDGRYNVNFPTKLMVFDLNGDYMATLETEYHITHFCYDKDNDRIILVLSDEMQFAYLNLGEFV